jgi:hypothetical protein
MTGIKYNTSMQMLQALPSLPRAPLLSNTVTLKHCYSQIAELVSGAVTTYKMLYCPTFCSAFIYHLLFVHPCIMDQISPGIT